MRMSIVTIALLLVFPLGLIAQDSFKETTKRQISIVRTEEVPKIDGILDDEVWKKAPVATSFVQETPDPKAPASYKTEVRLLYDNSAIYLSAMLYDEPDSIFKALSERDNLANTAWFGIFIDAYQDGINGNAFVVTPSGIQLDVKHSASGQDVNWNAVWKSEAKINEEGWVVEMKLPFSALRFPKSDIQTWNINFGRRIQRKGEMAWWSHIDQQIRGFYNQAGEITGIQDIESPLRLAFYPFVSSILDHYPNGDAEVSNWGRDFNAGMDIKYGINDAFTLDMTLIPDFGQTRSDNEVLNLSPFEVRFDENRQFFTEGTELFNKGNLFYSRRVGGRLARYWDVEGQLEENEEIKENPKESQLYNSTKISGRTESGLGIGVFNAISAPTYATIVKTEEDTTTERTFLTNPLTNYNVFVLDQNLRNNSFVSFVNTNVYREGGEDFAYEANVTGSVFKIRDKKSKFDVAGGAVLSQKYNDNFNSPELGHSYYLDFETIEGNFQYSLWHSSKDNNYDVNDLGFNTQNNIQNFGARFSYNKFQPFGKFLSMYNGVRFIHNRQYKPNAFQDFQIIGYSEAQYVNFWRSEFWFFTAPVHAHDYYETRTAGRFFKRPRDFTTGGWLQTDERKRIGTRLRWRIGTYFEKGSFSDEFAIAPWFQISDKLQLELDLWYDGDIKELGFVSKSIEDEEVPEDAIVFGRRTVNTLENVLSARYIFTNNMGLSFRARHYWSGARYHNFYKLLDDGNLEDIAYTGIDVDGNPSHNINFNVFNIDMVYTWQFLPGSELSIVWKNAIFTDANEVENNYFQNLGNTFRSPQNNNFSIKVLFFVDALYLKRKGKRDLLN